MSERHFLRDGPRDARLRFLLAHGAGAPMDTPFMTSFAEALAAAGAEIVRFEFAYMAARREGAGRRPPPRAERLMDEYRDAVAALGDGRPLIIGGKSLGGRVAALVAQDLAAEGRVAGLLCLGFPFHPPRKPEKSRLGTLTGLTLPTLICQGTRDPFGSRDEVEAYDMPPAIRIHWAPDGDHDLAPRKSSGHDREGNWRKAASAIITWSEGLA